MCFSRRGIGLVFALLVVVGAVATAREPISSSTDQTKNAENQRAYEIPDAVLLDYVKAQMLRGLGLQEPPRVRRAAVIQNREYEQVYEEYRKRLEEDDLLDDAEDPQNFSGLQRLYTIRSSGGPYTEEDGGFTQHIRFRIPESASENLVSARLRLRLNRRLQPHTCSVKVYKIDDELKYLVAELHTLPETPSRSHSGRFRKVVDLTSSMKGWLRSSDPVEFQVWQSRRGCLRGLPTFDVMAKEVSASPSKARSKRSISTRGDRLTPNSEKLGATRRMCSGENDKACCMRSLNVSVADFGWDEWIIEPKTFQANFCRGQCLYKHGHFASSHAALQSKISRILGHKTVPRPCCAPTKLKALPVMYQDSQGGMHFGRIPKMIVKECACS